MKQLIAALILAASLFAQSAAPLSNIKKIYVEQMPNNLNQYLTSELSKQVHGHLTVVLQASGADAIMKGVNIGAQDTTSATVQLVDPNGEKVLWSGTAGDRSAKFLDLKHGGEEKIAAHLVSQRHKAMQPKWSGAERPRIQRTFNEVVTL